MQQDLEGMRNEQEKGKNELADLKEGQGQATQQGAPPAAGMAPVGRNASWYVPQKSDGTGPWQPSKVELKGWCPYGSDTPLDYDDAVTLQAKVLELLLGDQVFGLVL